MRRSSPARQHVPSSIAAGSGDFREIRRHPWVHELAAGGADRFRRLPNLLSARQPHVVRGTCGVHQLHRRHADSPESGTQHRGAKNHRRGYHDGARSMRARDRRLPGGTQRHAAHASLGAAQPRGARRFSAGAVRHRAGSELRGSARRKRADHRADALRRLCHRRPRRGREQRAARRLHRHRHRIAAAATVRDT